jgi:hypothetical protein
VLDGLETGHVTRLLPHDTPMERALPDASAGRIGRSARASSAGSLIVSGGEPDPLMDESTSGQDLQGCTLAPENWGGKVGHGSGGVISLRAAQ